MMLLLAPVQSCCCDEIRKAKKPSNLTERNESQTKKEVRFVEKTEVFKYNQKNSLNSKAKKVDGRLRDHTSLGILGFSSKLSVVSFFLKGCEYKEKRNEMTSAKRKHPKLVKKDGCILQSCTRAVFDINFAVLEYFELKRFHRAEIPIHNRKEDITRIM